MTLFKLVLGTPVTGVPRPWLFIRVPGIMVNAYELMRRGIDKLRGRGLRRLLGIDGMDNVELWIDSGGYQFLRRGLDPGVEKIAKLYREVDADYYVSLDYPPSPRDDPETRAAKIAKTLRSYMELRSAVRELAEDGRLVPVLHLAVDRTLRMQLECYESTATTAAVGGLVPYFMQLAGRWSRLKAVTFLVLVRKLWHGRLHALGLASSAIIPLLRLIGIDSGDTQTWRHKAAYGKIVVPGIGERHVSSRDVGFGPTSLSEAEKKIVEALADEVSRVYGFKLDLHGSFEARALFNAWVLLTVSSNGYEKYVGPSPAFRKLYAMVGEFMKFDPARLESMLDSMLRDSSSPLELRGSSPT